jgi:hypothetical protein
MNVNDKPYFKGVHFKEVFNKEFSAIHFEEKSKKEIMFIVSSLAPKAVSSVKNLVPGIETAYHCYVNGFIILVWTTYVESMNMLRPNDNGWVLIIDPRNPELFYSFPLNRTKHYIANLVTTARVYREVAIHWPTCTCCKEKMFWSKVMSDDFEVIDEQFHNRIVVCKNELCENYYLDINFPVTQIALPVEKDRKFFAKPFERNQRIRTKNRVHGTQTIPRRLIRFFKKLGINLPVKKKTYSVYNDTEYEKQQKGKFLYNEEVPDDVNYHD